MLTTLNTLKKFISKQRNLIFNISEFTRKKQQNIDNFKNVDMNNNDANTFKETKFEIIKSIMFNENKIRFEN